MTSRKTNNSLSGTVADYIAKSLRQRGTRRMFGVPGGGSSLDLIRAGAREGIDFILTQTETAATLMAAVTAELSGTPGVALTGVGPGAASAVNGIAYASLEKSPVVLLTDAQEAGNSLHQVFDQEALFRPLVKGGCRLTPDTLGVFDDLLDAALSRPFGPVHIDLTANDAALAAPAPGDFTVRDEGDLQGDEQAACDLVRQSSRAVILVGLDARSNEAAEGLQRLASGLAAPVFCTYKAKGVMPDDDAAMIGMFTGAAAEFDCINKADLIICYGLDPVELIPGRWPYTAPVLELANASGHQLPCPPAAGLYGPLQNIVMALEQDLKPGDWTMGEITQFRQRMSRRLSLSTPGHNTETVTRAVQKAAPAGTRLTVDAGAHMISAMATWRASTPFGGLKSNGLSSMGFALPAAIASTLEQPDVPVAALTGDGGMMMCLAELATARRVGGKIVCVVLNDATLSLIDVKQQRRQHRSSGVTYPRNNFAAVAEGLGCPSWRVAADDDLDAILAKAFACEGPALIDVAVDPSGYTAQLEALRG